jgi:hypothetical protein
MKNRGSVVEGVDLYYPLRQEGGRITYELIPEPFVDTWTNSSAWREMNPQFKWNEEAGGWCLIWSIAGNPFNAKLYHTARDMEAAENAAKKLRGLGLMKGVSEEDGVVNFDLGRPATRAEGLTMLIRLLGKEEEALTGSWTHPFTDAGWADKYIGYAYENGLTKGQSATVFGSGDTVTAQQYMTFLLRALQYDDSQNQIYGQALELAGAAGIMRTDEDAFEVCVNSFWRADMAVASLRALGCKTPSGKTLADVLGIELIKAGN